MAVADRCFVPNCREKRLIGQWHCTSCRQKHLPRYRKYKEYEKSQMWWFNQTPSLSLGDRELLHRYAVLVQAYKLRRDHRQQALAPEYWDMEHEKYMKGLLRKQFVYLKLLEELFATEVSTEVESEQSETVETRHSIASQKQARKVRQFREVLTTENMLDAEAEAYLRQAEAAHAERAQLIASIQSDWQRLHCVPDHLLQSALVFCWQLYSYPFRGAEWPRCIPILYPTINSHFDPRGSTDVLRQFSACLAKDKLPFAPLWSKLDANISKDEPLVVYLLSKNWYYDESDVDMMCQASEILAGQFASYFDTVWAKLGLLSNLKVRHTTTKHKRLIVTALECNESAHIEQLELQGVDIPVISEHLLTLERGMEQAFESYYDDDNFMRTILKKLDSKLIAAIHEAYAIMNRRRKFDVTPRLFSTFMNMIVATRVRLRFLFVGDVLPAAYSGLYNKQRRDALMALSHIVVDHCEIH